MWTKDCGGNYYKTKELQQPRCDDSHVDRLVNCENFCENCKEVDCVCSTDETCSMIREYLRLKEFHSSVGCLFAEGVEFMTKVEIYDAIKSDFQKTMPISSIGS